MPPFPTAERRVLGTASPSQQQAQLNWAYPSWPNPYGLQLRLTGYVNQLYVQAVSLTAVDAAMREVAQTLATRRRIKPGAIQDLSVHNLSQIAAAAKSSSRIMALLLAAVASILLLVGGIGIMNILLVSVTERTREVGLRMAIGARRLHVLLQFRAEAVFLSVTGGIAGIVLGMAFSWGVTIMRLAGAGVGPRHCRCLPVLGHSGDILRLLPRAQGSTSRPGRGAKIRVIRLHLRMPCMSWLSWLMVTFAAPMLWSLSTHIDAYLVDRHFRCGSVTVLLGFIADTGLMLASAIWVLRLDTIALPLSRQVLIVLSGRFSRGRSSVLRRCGRRDLSRDAQVSSGLI
jgi:ABC-type antimicrobial peptide transport system permease subunit